MANTALQQPKRIRHPKGAAIQIRTFRSAVNYLDSLTNYERVRRAQYTSSNFGLARMSRLLAALGNPHRRFKVVHIAGTKGKGSVATMVAEMLRACGMKVGLYTSPHILDIRERIAVNGALIGEAAFMRAVLAVSEITEKARVPSPTYFEVLTAAAFVHFVTKGANIAVVETGLGGRLDATNVVNPEVVGMTSISYDHIAQLGSTLTAIATEKAGVFKEGVPIVCAPQPDSVKKTLREAAKRVHAPLKFSDENVGFSYRFEFSRTAGRHARICLTTENSRFEHLHVPLLGEHQATNCAVALNILDVLKTRGFPLDDERATAGLQKIRLPGRMEIIREEPRILVDGAHNAASVEALVRAIGQNIPYDSMVMIFGCQKDKDITRMIRQVQLGADKCIFTSTGSPRSAEPSELAAEYAEQSGRAAQVADTLDEAMQIALRAVTREDLICITGSFYLVGQAKRRYSDKPAD